MYNSTDFPTITQTLEPQKNNDRSMGVSVDAESKQPFPDPTSAISKGLEDIDHGLLTFVSEEEAAEEELRRIHGLLGADIKSPFRTY